MNGKIFVLRGEGLTELTQTRYENEDLFQSLIEKHPEILAGEQINPDNPRKWILISREMGVPLDARRGSLDHLFIDQDAIPTFIEVKRSTDTRIRREVVGQMLDYAANGIQLWPVKDIWAFYERNSINGDVTTLDDIGITDEDAFWERVGINLRSGKVRLMFVADEIPASLRAIIEYLNEQMRDTEVFGLEIKQFCGADGLTTLVPNLIGRTANAIKTKEADSKQRYSNRDDFFDSVEDTTIYGLYQELFAFADKHGYTIRMGTSGFSLSIADLPGKLNPLLFGYGNDAAHKGYSIETTFGRLKDIDSNILEHYKREIGKLRFAESTASGNYKWQLTSESTCEEMQMFLAVVQDVADKISAH